MIFVTVGTAGQGFQRLVGAADGLARLVDEPVVIQRGHNRYEPQAAESFDWGSVEEMNDWMRQARLVIAQAGAGTVISVFKQNKPLILCPRLKAFGENYNDHQIELAEALQRKKRVVMVLHPTAESLLEAVSRTEQLDRSPMDNTPLIQALRQQFTSWEQAGGRRS
jgi:UDP-N-acetylglucosamine transferase subunit ALG13